MHGKRLWLIALALLALVPFFVTDTYAKKGGNKPPPPPSSPADPVIVYRETSPLPNTLKVMDADGSNQATIYEAQSGWVNPPSWSGDGQHVLFMEHDNYLPEPNSILCRVDVDVVDGVPQGSNRTVLVDDIGVLDAWCSPQSDRIAFVAESTPNDPFTRHVRMVGANGGTHQIIYTPPQGRSVHGVQWSPDGNRIAFLETDWAIEFPIEDVRVIDLTTGGITTYRLPSYEDPDDDTAYLTWPKTQDDVIAYVAPNGTHLLDLATGETQLFLSHGLSSWSPDDSQIVFNGSVEVPRKGKNKTTTLNGIVKYTLATGVSTFLGEGRSPDWRR